MRQERQDSRARRYKTLTLILLYLFFVPLAIDGAVTYGTYKTNGHMMRESYPPFVLFGNTFGIAFVLLIAVAWYFVITKYSERGPNECFLTVSIIVWTLPARSLAILSNINAILHPISYEVAASSQELSAASKISFYGYFVALLIFLPIVIQYVCYWLFTQRYVVIDRGLGK